MSSSVYNVSASLYNVLYVVSVKSSDKQLMLYCLILIHSYVPQQMCVYTGGGSFRFLPYVAYNDDDTCYPPRSIDLGHLVDVEICSV